MENRDRRIKRTTLVLLQLLILLGTYFIFNFPQSKDMNVIYSYSLLIISYFFIGGSFILIADKYRFNVFDYIVIIFIFDFLCLVIAPIIFIITDNINCHGVYIMDGGAKGTILHLIAYIGLMLGWISKNKISNKLRFTIRPIEVKYNSTYAFIAITLWMIFFLLSLIYHLASGKSLIYILTVGMIDQGINNDNVLDTPLKFLINVSYCLIPLWLYIVYYSRSLSIKFITGFGTFVIYMVGGYRFIIVAMVLSYFVTYYLIRNKKPSLKIMLGSLILFIFFVTITGYVRSGLRSGNGFSLQGISLDELFTVLQTNFDIYQTYYGVVADVPKVIPHTYGSAMIIDPFIYFIPRSLWHAKPPVDSMTLLATMINSVGRNVIVGAGMSTVWLTEIYIDFGILGCFFIPMLVGKVLKNIKLRCLFKNRNINSIIIYSVLYGVMMQIIIRGYTAMNVWIVAFLLLPIPLIKIIFNILTKK